MEPEFELGPVRVRPRERLLEAARSSITVEPLVMQLLIALSRRAGQVLTRQQIFETCWGAQPVGDDSLNRIVAVLRKALQQIGDGSVTIETVPSVGYVLRLGGEKPSGEHAPSEVDRALEAAMDSWRLGLPDPDHLHLELLRRACRLEPNNGAPWGALALLCRHAAEYASPAEASDFVAECERSARRALSLAPAQPEALTALASVAPLFGRWIDARRRLEAVLAANPPHAPASHDLAIVEMATGRVSAAKEIMDRLLAADPLAACYCYKSVYQNWSVGKFATMDHVADRAVQLWPTHPAVWTARLWTLAYTGRAKAALAMIDDDTVRPRLPPPLLSFLQLVLTEAAFPSKDKHAEAVQAALRLAAKGPTQAVASFFALGLLKAADELFAVADAYYLRTGDVAVPVRHGLDELAVNDQHRRVTQILFTPVFGAVRSDDRFMSLCDRIGLTECWKTTVLEPDFLRPDRPN